MAFVATVIPLTLYIPIQTTSDYYSPIPICLLSVLHHPSILNVQFFSFTCSWCYWSNHVMHKFTLSCASHTITTLSPMLSIAFLYSQFINLKSFLFTSLPC